MLDKVTLETFQTHQDSDFVVNFADGSQVVFRLEELSARPARQARPGHRAPFSLVWKAPKTWFFPQGVYPLEHSELGLLELFMVPIGEEEDGFLYETVFN